MLEAACKSAAAITAAEFGEPTEDVGGGRVACGEKESPPGDGVADGFGDDEEPIVIAAVTSLEDVDLPDGTDLVEGEDTDEDFCAEEEGKCELGK